MRDSARYSSSRVTAGRRSSSSPTARRTPTPERSRSTSFPGASFDEGLAFLAPIDVRARDLPRVLLRGARGAGLRTDRAFAGRDLDRIVVRCDRPLPLQVDGEDAGDVTEAVYEAERDAVTVLV